MLPSIYLLITLTINYEAPENLFFSSSYISDSHRSGVNIQCDIYIMYYRFVRHKKRYCRKARSQQRDSCFSPPKYNKYHSNSPHVRICLFSKQQIMRDTFLKFFLEGKKFPSIPPLYFIVTIPNIA